MYFSIVLYESVIPLIYIHSLSFLNILIYDRCITLYYFILLYFSIFYRVKSFFFILHFFFIWEEDDIILFRSILADCTFTHSLFSWHWLISVSVSSTLQFFKVATSFSFHEDTLSMKIQHVAVSEHSAEKNSSKKEVEEQRL